MSGKQVPDLGGLIQTKGAPRPSDILSGVRHFPRLLHRRHRFKP